MLTIQSLKQELNSKKKCESGRKKKLASYVKSPGLIKKMPAKDQTLVFASAADMTRTKNVQLFQD